MKNNWQTKKLGDVLVALESGSRPKGGVSSILSGIPSIGGEHINYSGGFNLEKIRYVPQDFHSSLRRGHIMRGDVLVVKDGATTGKVSYVDDKFPFKQAIVNEHVFILRTDSKLVNDKFLFYFLFSKNGQEKILSTFHGAAQGGINSNFVNNIEIPVPPIEEQRGIVAKLEKILSKIDQTKKINRQTIFESEDLVSSLENEIFSGKSFKKVFLREVCRYEGGTQPPKSTFIYEPREGFIRLLQIRDYKNDDKAVYIPIKERHKECTATDIMIGRYGPPVFQILRGKSGAYNVALMKCVPDNSRISNDWLYHFLRSRLIQDHVIGKSMRARQAGVRPDVLDELEIPLPDINEQTGIVRELNSITEKVHKLKKIQEGKLTEFDTLLTSILDQAFEGKL